MGIVERTTPSQYLVEAEQSVKTHGLKKLDSVLYSALTMKTEQPG